MTTTVVRKIMAAVVMTVTIAMRKIMVMVVMTVTTVMIVMIRSDDSGDRDDSANSADDDKV